jgi:hypothetical protein
MMNTNLKVILAAISIAALTSPVMAHSGSHRHAAPLGTYGSAAGARTAPVIEGNQFYLNDAVHVPFPQQDGGV